MVYDTRAAVMINFDGSVFRHGNVLDSNPDAELLFVIFEFLTRKQRII